MEYLLKKLTEVKTPDLNKLKKENFFKIISRTTLILQNFVYWEAILLRNNKTPEKIKDMLLSDINEEISDLDEGAHVSLSEKFRKDVELKTQMKTSDEEFFQIKEISEKIINELKENSFVFGFSFLTTLENYNSMNFLESIARELNIDKVKYIEVHKEVDHSEGGHADNFLFHLENLPNFDENQYKKGVDFAIKVINFRLGRDFN